MNGIASTCACRSPSRNENHGNSLIVSGDHARRREPVVVARRAGGVEPARAPRRGCRARCRRRRPPARPTTGPPRTLSSRGRAAAHSVPASVNTATAISAEQQREREVVAHVGSDAGDPDQHRHHQVAEVVVVEVLARHPRVVRRERRRRVDGVHERHVHRLLGPPHVGRVGDEQRHHGERDREDEPRRRSTGRGAPGRRRGHARAAIQSRRTRPSQPCGPSARRAAARRYRWRAATSTPTTISTAGDHEHRGRRVRRDPDRREHPHQPRDEQQAERLGEARARRRAAVRTASPASGAAARPDHLDQREEAERLEHRRRQARSWRRRVRRLPRTMSTYERVADLPLTIDDYALEGLVAPGVERLRAPARRSSTCAAAARRASARTSPTTPREQEIAAGARPGAPARRRVDVRLVLGASRRARPLPRRRAAHGRLPQLPPLGVRERGARPRAAPGRHLAGRRSSERPPQPVRVRRLVPHGRAADDSGR